MYFLSALLEWQNTRYPQKLEQMKQNNQIQIKSRFAVSERVLTKEAHRIWFNSIQTIKIIQETVSSIYFYSILPKVGLVQTPSDSWLWGSDAELTAEGENKESEGTAELATGRSEEIPEAAALDELQQHQRPRSNMNTTHTPTNSYKYLFLLRQHS